MDNKEKERGGVLTNQEIEKDLAARKSAMGAEPQGAQDTGDQRPREQGPDDQHAADRARLSEGGQTGG